MTGSAQIIHASCVAVEQRGALIVGSSGAGKSTLALELMSRGAELVCDDQTLLEPCDTGIVARPVPSILGMIEARGIGLLNAKVRHMANVSVVIDLDTVETERLPPVRRTTILSREILCLYRVNSAGFPAAVIQFLRYGRAEV